MDLIYFDESAPIKAYITNIGKYAEGDIAGAWHSFPTTPEALARTFEKISIDGVNYEEWFITDFKTDIDGIKINQYDNLDVINYLANNLEALSKSEIEQLEAVAEYYDGNDIADFINISENDNLSCFDLIPDVSDEKELGYYLIEERGDINTDNMGELAKYIDYESYGRDHSLNAQGDFVAAGFVEKTGDIDKVFNGKDVPEEYRVTAEARSIIKEKQQEKAKTKNSIQARIKAAQAAEKSALENSEPTQKKNKTNDIDL